MIFQPKPPIPRAIMFEALSLFYSELLSGLNVTFKYEILQNTPAKLRVTFKCTKTRRAMVVERLQDVRAITALWRSHFPRNEHLQRSPHVESVDETTVRTEICTLCQAVE